MTIKTVLIILNIAGLIGSLIWLMIDQSWEPLVTAIGLIGALIVQIKLKSDNAGNVTMKQKGGKGSTNYQSGRDINIRK